MKGNRSLCCLVAMQVVLCLPLFAYQDAKTPSSKDTATVNSWYRLAYDSLEVNLRRSDEIINKAWKMAITIGYEQGIADGYYYTGCVYEKKQQLDTASRYLERAALLYRDGFFFQNLPDCYMRLGKIRLTENKPYAAMRDFLNGLYVAEDQENGIARMKLNIQIANYHNSISKNYQAALAALAAAEKTGKTQSDDDALGYINKLYAISYAGLQDFDAALRYCQRAQHEFAQSQDSHNLLETLLITASIHAKKSDQPRLASTLDQAKPLLDAVKSQLLTLQYNLLEATNAYFLKAYARALAICELLEQQLDHHSPYDVWRAVRALHFRILFVVGNGQRADSLFNEYEFVRDSVYAAQYIGQGVEMSEDYKLDRFERQIKEQELRLTTTRYERYGLIAGIVVLLTILAILYFHFREKDRLAHRVAVKNAEISVQNDVLKQANRQNELLLREIHHRVKNNLQIISSLLNLQARGTASEEVVSMTKESSSRINSIALIHNKLYEQQSLSLLNVQDYIEQLTIHLLSIYNVDKKPIRFHIHALGISLDIDTAIPLGLILTELVTNSLKYAFIERNEGDIYIELFYHGGKDYALIFKDNGRGIPEEKRNHAGNTLGFRLIHSLTRQLSGSVHYTFGTFSMYHIPFKALG